MNNKLFVWTALDHDRLNDFYSSGLYVAVAASAEDAVEVIRQSMFDMEFFSQIVHRDDCKLHPNGNQYRTRCALLTDEEIKQQINRRLQYTVEKLTELTPRVCDLETKLCFYEEAVG